LIREARLYTDFLACQVISIKLFRSLKIISEFIWFITNEVAHQSLSLLSIEVLLKFNRRELYTSVLICQAFFKTYFLLINTYHNCILL